MVALDESIIARLKTHGKTFEVFVDPEGALALKRGEAVKIENIIAVEDVFSDAKNGDRPAEQDVMNAFGTTDALKIAQKIIIDGELHLTTEQNKQIKEEKKARVINIIPIRFEEVRIAIKLPAEFAAKAYGGVAGFGTLTKQEWQNDGSWIGVITIPDGRQDEQ